MIIARYPSNFKPSIHTIDEYIYPKWPCGTIAITIEEKVPVVFIVSQMILIVV